MRRIALLLFVFILFAAWLLAGCREQQNAASPEASQQQTQQAQEPAKPQPPVPEIPGLPFEAKEPVDLDEVRPDLKSSDRSKRLQALDALPRVKGEKQREEALRILQQTFGTDPDPVIRSAALTAMSEFPLAKTKAYFIRAVRDPAPSVRETAVNGLIRSGSLEAASVLMEAMQDAAASVRYAAAQGYCRLVAKQPKDVACRKLIEALYSDDFELRAQATMALVPMGHDAVPYLIEAVGKGPWYTRAAVATALGMAAGGTSQRQAEWAKQVASDFKADADAAPPDTRATPALIKALHDPDFRVRLAAAQGLGLQANPEAAKACAEALRDPNVEVRQHAASALTVLPTDGLWDKLIEALHDPDKDVRRYIIEAISGLPANVAVPALIELVQREKNPRNLEEAADSLGRLGDKRATEPLIKLFDNPNPDVRWAAVRAVGKFEDRRAIGPLRKRLKDKAPWVAYSAEHALHRLRIKATAPRGIPE